MSPIGERPLCKCHGEPMKKSGFYKGKQQFCCVVKSAESMAKYRASKKGKDTEAKYNASEKGKASEAKAQAKYNASEKGKIRQAKYNAKRRSDPEYRKQKTIYMVFYNQRKKVEKYGRDGLIDQRFPRGNDGQEADSRRDRAA